MCSEIKQTKKNTAWYHIYVQSKKKKNQTHRNRVGRWVPGPAGEEIKEQSCIFRLTSYLVT